MDFLDDETLMFISNLISKKGDDEFIKIYFIFDVGLYRLSYRASSQVNSFLHINFFK